MEISLCMIVKNEEAMLPRCIHSVSKAVDEIIIVDTGSTDATKKIAAELGSRVFDFPWCDDFSKARNFSFSKASKGYILWLDADDYLTSENQEKLLQLKSELPPEADYVSMSYSLIRDELGNTTSALRRNRLVKRDKAFQWVGHIHEYLEVHGQQYHSDVEIWHDKHKEYNDRNLKIYRKMKAEKQKFSARDQYYYANELFYNGFFEEAITEYTAFLDSKLGWVEDNKQATINLVACLNQTNQQSKIMPCILESFQWGKPHAELCCRLAECFMRENRYEETIFWYQTALNCRPGKNNMALSSNIYYTFIPAIQLCVCYSRIGDYPAANAYNELAAQFDPGSPMVLHNREYLIRFLKPHKADDEGNE